MGAADITCVSTDLPPANPAATVDPEGEGTIAVNVVNDGARASEGPITVTDVLPPGVTATEAGDLELFPTCRHTPNLEPSTGNVRSRPGPKR